MYSVFSSFYDSFTLDIDYKKIADNYQAIFKKLKVTPSEVLDLGCGTGSLTIELSKRGYDLTGVDISVNMLDIARKKAEKEGGDILFINQDITRLDLFGTVDAALSSLDVINHITDKRELLRCFEKVSLFLIPNGVFIFDINTPYKFIKEYGFNTYVFENEDKTCIWQNSFNKKTKICDFYLTFFEKQGELYKRYEDFTSERMYSVGEICDLLNRAGLKVKGIYDGKSLKKLKDTDSRAIIAAKKEI